MSGRSPAASKATAGTFCARTTQLSSVRVTDPQVMASWPSGRAAKAHRKVHALDLSCRIFPWLFSPCPILLLAWSPPGWPTPNPSLPGLFLTSDPFLASPHLPKAQPVPGPARLAGFQHMSWLLGHRVKCLDRIGVPSPALPCDRPPFASSPRVKECCHAIDDPGLFLFLSYRLLKTAHLCLSRDPANSEGRVLARLVHAPSKAML